MPAGKHTGAHLAPKKTGKENNRRTEASAPHSLRQEKPLHMHTVMPEDKEKEEAAVPFGELRDERNAPREQVREETKAEEPADKTGRKKNKAVANILLAVLIIALTYVGFRAYYVFFKPQALFKSEPVSAAATPAPVQKVQPAVETDGSGPAESTPEPVEPDEPIVQDGILNILLCGIDKYSDGRTTSGTEPHTDANLVITVNFNEDRVDVTSILRDTFTVAPNGDGYYKFNSIFNLGGGTDDIQAGLDLTRTMAEKYMGGISIPHYYAFDLTEVIDLVNAIGGVDYDMDISYTGHSGTRYNAGPQHLDGVGVLDYCRARKNVDGLDSNRSARQRRMLMAVFNQLKSQDLITTVPALLGTYSRGVFTNVSAEQTVALANYAMKLSSDSISMHSLESTLAYNFDWILNFIDMDKRAVLLKEIYGIDAAPIKTCSMFYQRYLYEMGFDLIKYYKQAEKVLTEVNRLTEAGIELTPEQKELYLDCYAAYEDMLAYFDETSAFAQSQYAAPLSTDEAMSTYKHYVNVYTPEKKHEIMNASEALRKELCPDLKLEWEHRRYDQDPDINRVIVDFG